MEAIVINLLFLSLAFLLFQSIISAIALLVYGLFIKKKKNGA
ncbi:MAG: hypothetical protein R3293_19345 [Candidatus Promineifilaceae bacterium]|nr:hypothetical protein [Candidatus Promineifilaceae bacterium]